MKCKQCGASGNPRHIKCEYCQTYYPEKKAEIVAHVSLSVQNRQASIALESYAAQLAYQQRNNAIQSSHLMGLAGIFGGRF